MKLSHKIRPNRLQYLVVALGTILIVVQFWQLVPSSLMLNQNSDYLAFHKVVAQNLVAGKGYVTDQNGFPGRYPPGYPLLLALLFFISDKLAISTDIVLSGFTLLAIALSSMMVFWLAKTLYSTSLAIVSVLLWISYPFSLWLTKQPNSEIPFILILYSAVTLLWYAVNKPVHQRSLYYTIGLLVGLAMLIRPILIGGAIVFSLMFVVLKSGISKRERVLTILLICLGNLTVVSPWIAYAYIKTGKPILLSTGAIPGIRDGITCFVNKKGFREGIQIPEDVEVLSKRIAGRQHEMISASGVGTVIFEEFNTDKRAALKLVMIKAHRSWHATDSQKYESWTRGIQLLYFIMILVATGIAFREKGKIQKMACAVWILVIYFWIMTIISLSIMRYMVPAIGLLFMFIPALFLQARRVHLACSTSRYAEQLKLN